MRAGDSDGSTDQLTRTRSGGRCHLGGSSLKVVIKVNLYNIKFKCFILVIPTPWEANRRKGWIRYNMRNIEDI